MGETKVLRRWSVCFTDRYEIRVIPYDIVSHCESRRTFSKLLSPRFSSAVRRGVNAVIFLLFFNNFLPNSMRV